MNIRALVEDHYEAVYRFAYRLCGNAQDAEDLTQEAFCVAQTRLRQLRSTDRARAWLFTIVRNIYLQQHRRTLPVGRTALDEVPDPSSASDSLTAGESVDEAHLHQALLRLPETYRTPLLLYYFGEFSYREIAEILGLPVGTVMSRLARAKAQLRAQLGLAVPTGHEPGGGGHAL
jgi:RNA polymerase sigma-70 factor (ECF subfamily)